jgi:two-component sensor histidine kinase/PAS domain-containing protein
MSTAVRAISGVRRIARLALARGTHPIAIHLGWFATGVLVPVLSVVAFILIDSARLWQEDAMHDARLFADHLNETIDIELQRASAVGQTLAASFNPDDNDQGRFAAEARDVARLLGFNITVRDRTGQQIVNSLMPDTDPLPVSNDDVRALDRLAAERRRPVISGLLRGTIRHLPVVIVDVPVPRGDDVPYFISVAMQPDRVREILVAGLPDGWIAGVIGRDGRLIARSAAQDQYLGSVNQPFIDTARDNAGTWSGVSREGTAIAGFYVRSPLSDWIVSVAVPRTALVAPVRLAILSVSGLIALALVVSGWFGWRFSRRIAGPIRDLADLARGMGQGRTPSIQPSRVEEVNAVARALRSASVELERRSAAAIAAAETVGINEERLQLLQETAGIGTIDWDIAAERAICSPRLYDMLALPVGRQPVFADFMARVHPDERQRAERLCNELAAAGGHFQNEIRIVLENGAERWIYARGRMELLDGQPCRLLAACIDITERKTSEQHLHFLLREISHRSKNLLAVIQAMATQTAISAGTVADFRRRLGDRLMGMAASHDLLVNQNWTGASVEHLVRGQLAPFIDAEDPRPRIHGPALNLKATAAEALGLALHELATNSLKYGALADPSGVVEIVWDIYDTGTPDGPDGRGFRIEWTEQTMTPVAPPDHRGFGRLVIERMVQSTFNGRVSLEFPPEGLRWRLDAPATCLAPMSTALAA